MQSRRQFGRRILGTLAAPSVLSLAKGTFSGVRVGAVSYSFRDIPRTDPADGIGPVLAAFKESGATITELFSPQLEPAMPEGVKRGSPEAQKYRDEVRQWRLSTSADYFKKARKRFDSAGVELYAYTLNFRPDYTDEEIDKCFQQAKALGTKVVSASTVVSMLPRLTPVAEKYNLLFAVHGHSDTAHPDEFSSPETFAKALSASKNCRVNLDIGHFSAAGFDPVAYIKENHQHITHLHIKDRKKNNGPNEPFGEGDTPIKEVLQLLKKDKYPIPALVEYEYKGTASSPDEVKKCLAYMKDALA